MWMRMIVLQLNVFGVKTKKIFYFVVELHNRKRSLLTTQLSQHQSNRHKVLSDALNAQLVSEHAILRNRMLHIGCTKKRPKDGIGNLTLSDCKISSI